MILMYLLLMLSIYLVSIPQGTLRPKPKLSKKRDDPLETDLCQPGSTQTCSATPQLSMDLQAEEWSLSSNMLPMDSDEIENWCEGVSHMLLSDAFVPVSEEIGENSTDLKVFVSSSPHEEEEHTLSLPKSEETPSEISDEVCYFKKHLTAVHYKCTIVWDKSHEKSPDHILPKNSKENFFA